MFNGNCWFWKTSSLTRSRTAAGARCVCVCVFFYTFICFANGQGIAFVFMIAFFILLPTIVVWLIASYLLILAFKNTESRITVKQIYICTGIIAFFYLIYRCWTNTYLTFSNIKNTLFCQTHAKDFYHINWNKILFLVQCLTHHIVLRMNSLIMNTINMNKSFMNIKLLRFFVDLQNHKVSEF